jgi:oxygen-independent coproporphyrinogen-3 oxidase
MAATPLPPLTLTPAPGIYVHVPFCIRKCPYCDFYSLSDLSLRQPYLEALVQEIGMAQDLDAAADTLYFGGGTPSLLSSLMIAALVDAVCHRWEITSDAEITLEVNPGTVSRQQLTDLRTAGINRLSIGVQSFDAARLEFLGRIHSPEDACRAMAWARDAGFEKVGIDLIYGMPGQGQHQWIQDLRRVLDFKPEHLSCYMLTVAPGTVLAHRQQCGQVPMADENRQADLFLATFEFLGENGYLAYEVSNFAKTPQDRSRHNLKYWSQTPYLGLGPSAHSFIPFRRFWNHGSLHRYLAEVNRAKLPVAGQEVLTKEQQAIEAIYLGLRQASGIDGHAFSKRFGINVAQRFSGVIYPLVESGMGRWESQRFCLTPPGMLLMDRITAEMVALL